MSSNPKFTYESDPDDNVAGDDFIVESDDDDDEEEIVESDDDDEELVADIDDDDDDTPILPPSRISIPPPKVPSAPRISIPHPKVPSAPRTSIPPPKVPSAPKSPISIPQPSRSTQKFFKESEKEEILKQLKGLNIQDIIPTQDIPDITDLLYRDIDEDENDFEKRRRLTMEIKNNKRVEINNATAVLLGRKICKSMRLGIEYHNDERDVINYILDTIAST